MTSPIWLGSALGAERDAAPLVELFIVGMVRKAGVRQMVNMDGNGPGGELNDPALRREIELLGQLIETVARTGRPLHESEIDRALEVTHPAKCAQPAA